MDDDCDRCRRHKRLVGYADDVCTTCDHVPLCADCLALHTAEAQDDGTFRAVQGGS